MLQGGWAAKHNHTFQARFGFYLHQFLPGFPKTRVCTHMHGLHCVCLCDPMDCSPPSSSVHGISGKYAGTGYHFLLPGIFLTQASNPCLLSWQVGSLPLAPPGKPQMCLYQNMKGSNSVDSREMCTSGGKGVLSPPSPSRLPNVESLILCDH